MGVALDEELLDGCDSSWRGVALDGSPLEGWRLLLEGVEVVASLYEGCGVVTTTSGSFGGVGGRCLSKGREEDGEI